MIVFKDVSKTYPNGFTALKHVNLTINDVLLDYRVRENQQ